MQTHNTNVPAERLAILGAAGMKAAAHPSTEAPTRNE
jgi:hypothetical protein